MRKVLIFADLPLAVLARFKEKFEVCVHNRNESLASQLKGCDAIVVSVETKLDRQFIALVPDTVKVVGTYSVGLDHIDLKELGARKIQLLSTPDVLNAAVAETAVFLCLGAARRGTESIDLIRSGKWSGWTPNQLVGVQLAGKTAGIVGMGRIGREIAVRLRGLGLKIAYHNRMRLDARLEGAARYFANLEEMVAIADIVVIACPATPSTEGLFNAELIKKMQASAILVNIARGSIVNDDDLITALRTGGIYAAGLDVFANEPQIDKRYLDLPNAFILPHIGSSTLEARMEMGNVLIEGLQQIAEGKSPANLVKI